MPKMLAKCEVIATIGSAIRCKLCSSSSGTRILLWSRVDSKCSFRIQKAFPGLPTGKGWRHVSSCQAQLLASEVIPWVVQPTVGGCNTTPEVALSIELWLCCNPVKYQCVLGFVLLCCCYWSYIIETLWLQYFLLLKESMSFGVKRHAVPAELNEYVYRKQK